MNLLTEHVPLLRDKVRVESYARAIRKSVGKKDLVLDIGTGTGIMAFLALRSGAREVYAIEQRGVLRAARRIAEAHGLSDRIRWFHGKSGKVRLPTKADLLVTETLGHLGVDEAILEIVSDAHRRLVKTAGRVIPQDFSIMVEAVSLPSGYADWVAWRRPVEGISYRPLRALASQAVWALQRWPRRTLTRVRAVCSFSLRGLRKNPLPVEAECRMRVERSGTIHGIVGGFRATLARGVILDSRKTASWRPIFFPVQEPMGAKAGDQVRFKLRIEKDIQYSWRIRLERKGREVARSSGSTLLLHSAASP